MRESVYAELINKHGRKGLKRKKRIEAEKEKQVRESKRVFQTKSVCGQMPMDW